jgi:ribosome-associated protein
MIEIPGGPAIPDEEISFEFTRSGGAGGQHVNKVATRAVLVFDLDRSPSLSDEQKERIRSRLGRRVSAEGILRVAASTWRSQSANREEAIRRFVALLEGALARRKRRRATAPTAASRRKRLGEKRRRAEVKRGRKGSGNEGD